MSVPSAMQKLEERMADGSIFTDPGDILMMAQDLGFVVVNAEMDTGDGFILVDEENGIPEYGSHKVIGVNVKNELKSKKEFIAQELALYLVQKRIQEGNPLKLAQKDTLKLRSEVVREIQNNKKLSFFKAKKDQPLTEDEKETVYGPLGSVLSVPLPTKRLAEILQSNTEGSGLAALQRKQSELFNAAQFQKVREESVGYKTAQIKKPDDFRHRTLRTPMQIERDEEVTRLLETYVDLYKVREFRRINNRSCLMWFSMGLAVLLVGACITMMILWLPIVASQYPIDTPAPQASAEPASAQSTGEATGGKGGILDGLLISVAAAEVEKPVVTVTPVPAASPSPTEAAAATATPEASVSPDVTDAPAPTEAPEMSAQVKKAIDDYFNSEDTELNANSGFAKSIISTVLSSNASTGAKDIVAMLSICLIILTSVFLLLRMLFKYVLPSSEEERMQDFVKTVQKNDFKNQIVMLLNKNKQKDEILTYLETQEKAEVLEVLAMMSDTGTQNLQGALQALFGSNQPAVPPEPPKPPKQ